MRIPPRDDPHVGNTDKQSGGVSHGVAQGLQPVAVLKVKALATERQTFFTIHIRSTRDVGSRSTNLTRNASEDSKHRFVG